MEGQDATAGPDLTHKTIREICAIYWCQACQVYWRWDKGKGLRSWCGRDDDINPIVTRIINEQLGVDNVD